MSITDLTPEQLRQAADLKEKILGLQAELNQLLGDEVHSPVTIQEPVASKLAKARKGKRTFSAEARAKMSAAQQARWAAKRGMKLEAPQAGTTAEPKKKKVSQALLDALAKARAARAAKLKAEKGTTNAKKRVNPALSNARSEATKAMWAKRKAAKVKKADETTPF